jgi:hypothetical protein
MNAKWRGTFTGLVIEIVLPMVGMTFGITKLLAPHETLTLQ